MCRLAVKTGEFAMAWIGLVDQTEEKLDLVASAGMSPQQIGILNDCYSLTERASLGDSLVVRAVRQGKAAFANSPQTDDTIRSGMEHNVAEVNSTAVLPLIVAGSVRCPFDGQTTATLFGRVLSSSISRNGFSSVDTLFIVATGQATPVVNSWVNANGGNWSVGSNWSRGVPPAATDSVVIELSGTYTVTLTVTDADGASDVAAAPVAVTNVAPVVTSVLLPSDPVAVHAPVALGATFADAGTGDSHTGSFTLGAGGPVGR